MERRRSHFGRGEFEVFILEKKVNGMAKLVRRTMKFGFYLYRERNSSNKHLDRDFREIMYQGIWMVFQF